MKYSVIIGVFVGLLIPATASAACFCVHYGGVFAKDKVAQQKYDTEASKRFIPAIVRKRVKERLIYDWAKDGKFEKNWCKRMPKTCNMAKACAAAFTGTVIADKANGYSDKRAVRDGAVSCAIAMTAVFWAG